MKRVSGYQTTDGRLFSYDQKVQAREHQKALNVVAGLTQIGEKIHEDEFLERDSYGYPTIYNGEAFAGFVLRHAADIKLVLEGKLLAPSVNEGEIHGDE